MKILILGVNGFIGHHLVNRILNEKPDWQVFGMDLGTERIGAALNNPRFNFLEGDISINKEWIEYHIKKCDVIMPLVGLLLGGVSFQDLQITVGEAAIKYGAFIQSVVDFFIIALSIFAVVKAINAFKKAEEPAPAPAAPPAPPVPTNEEILLAEIRDLLKR